MKDNIKERLDSRFAKWLRLNMAERGLNNTELADRIGIRHETVSLWKRGMQTPKSYPVLKGLAEALDVKIETVMRYIYE